MRLPALILLFVTSQVASGPTWQREEKSDPLRKLEYSQFVLEGKYLIPPRGKSLSPPTLVARCQAGNFSFGHARGKFLTGYLSVDAVLDFRSSGVPVSLRLDEGKVQTDRWSQSTDGTGAFFDSMVFDNLLYGHMLPHKEGTNLPVYQVIIGVPEYLGAEIQVQFDMPEPDDVAEVCGAVWHKR
ncbi:MAG: hypothetical protein WA853_20930 [Candidatus Acidiferrum sp.]